MAVCLDAAQTSHSKYERFTSGSPWFNNRVKLAMDNSQPHG